MSSRSHLALLQVAKDRKRSLPVTCDAVAGLLNMSVDVEGKIAVIQAGGTSPPLSRPTSLTFISQTVLSALDCLPAK